MKKRFAAIMRVRSLLSASLSTHSDLGFNELELTQAGPFETWFWDFLRGRLANSH